MMQVSVDIRRSDLVKLNLYLLPRLKGNWIFIGVVALIIFAYLSISDTPANGASWLIAVLASVAGGIGGLLSGFIFSLIWILFTSTEKSGVLGKHTYTLSENALHESTPSNESVQKWSGVQSILKSDSSVCIRVNGYLFHLIPRRAFHSAEEYEQFGKMAYDYWKRAAKTFEADVRSAVT